MRKTNVVATKTKTVTVTATTKESGRRISVVVITIRARITKVVKTKTNATIRSPKTKTKARKIRGSKTINIKISKMLSPIISSKIRVNKSKATMLMVIAKTQLMQLLKGHNAGQDAETIVTATETVIATGIETTIKTRQLIQTIKARAARVKTLMHPSRRIVSRIKISRQVMMRTPPNRANSKAHQSLLHPSQQVKTLATLRLRQHQLNQMWMETRLATRQRNPKAKVLFTP